MKEIKFRAWCILGGTMLYLNDELSDISYYELFCHTPDNRAMNLMQFTGLQDKNGRDIYEGDIVDGLLSFKGGTLSTMGEVKYCEDTAAFGLINLSGLTLFHNHIIGSFRVKGNVYENPEMAVVS